MKPTGWSVPGFSWKWQKARYVETQAAMVAGRGLSWNWTLQGRSQQALICGAEKTRRPVGSCSALTTRNASLGLKTVTLYEKKKMTCNRVKVKLRSSTGISFADSNNILGKCRGQCWNLQEVNQLQSILWGFKGWGRGKLGLAGAVVTFTFRVLVSRWSVRPFIEQED